MPDASGLASIVDSDTKLGELENKISHVKGLVKKTVYDAYITTSDYNKLTRNILDA